METKQSDFLIYFLLLYCSNSKRFPFMNDVPPFSLWRYFHIFTFSALFAFSVSHSSGQSVLVFSEFLSNACAEKEGERRTESLRSKTWPWKNFARRFLIVIFWIMGITIYRLARQPANDPLLMRWKRTLLFVWADVLGSRKYTPLLTPLQRLLEEVK